MGGAIWELRSHVPGRPMGWTDDEMHAAGALLATFHRSSLALPPRPQRPGSHPLAECRPSHPAARPVRIAFERELADIGHRRAPRAVIHGDATQSNVVVDSRGAFHLVDFALAYDEALLADVGSVLWRNSRSSPDALTYDPARAARFVRGLRHRQADRARGGAGHRRVHEGSGPPTAAAVGAAPGQRRDGRPAARRYSGPAE